MRTVLVTGATGAIGTALVPELLRDPGTSLHLLVRAHSELHLRQRAAELSAYFSVSDPGTDWARVRVVAGDVAAPRLGLDPAMYGDLARHVTHVIHGAADVRLNRPASEARAAAVDSVQGVLDFARVCIANGQFRKADVLSTVGVAGAMEGVIPERVLPERRTFRNTYEAAKAEAENALAAALEEGLPLTIHRPSMVVGRSTDGRISHFQVFYHLCEFLSGTRTAGVVPRTDGLTLDVIPVDYVARAVRLASESVDTAGRVLHLCSGPELAPTIEWLGERVQRVFASHGKPTRPLRRIPPRMLATATSMVRPFTSGPLRGALASLPYFLAYLGTRQGFATRETGLFLQPHSVTIPRVDSYLDRVLAYYLATTTARAARRVAS